MSLSQIIVQFKGYSQIGVRNSQIHVRLLVRIIEYISDIIGRRFNKVRNGHRSENLTPIWELGKGHIFENCTPIWELKKKTYIWGWDVCDVEIGHGLDDWTSIWVLHCGLDWDFQQQLCTPSYMWGLVFHLHEVKHLVSTLFHWNGKIRFIILV